LLCCAVQFGFGGLVQAGSKSKQSKVSWRRYRKEVAQRMISTELGGTGKQADIVLVVSLHAEGGK
jgi:hypothetical protein